MKENWKTRVVGRCVILVPYRREHVDKYHAWMQDPLLQELTGSEPLSLEEEYEMQESWRNDEDKCTFILLDKALSEKCETELDCMIGDTNLFLSEGGKHAEAEIMIAEERARGQGRGKEAMALMLRYGIEKLGVELYSAKIKCNNVASINLFTSHFGFQEVSRSEVFQEVTLELPVTDAGVAEQIASLAPWELQEINSEI